jgi:hypothetical protein
MALNHATSGEIIGVRPLGKNLKQCVSVTLAKTAWRQVFRSMLLEGK